MAVTVATGITVVLSANAAGYCKTAVLRYGVNSSCTKQAQYSIGHVPTTPPYTSYFGARTRDRVKEYQRGRGLVADGVIGPKTWAAICRETQVGGDVVRLSAPRIGCTGAILRPGAYYYTGI